MKKIIITVLIVALVGAGIFGWWYMIHRFDRLLEDEVQQAATKAFGTSVTVGDIDLDFFKGSVRIEELAIGNPPGFVRPHALIFGSIEAAFDYEEAEVSRIVLDNSRVFIEENGGATNIQQLRQALESHITRDAGYDPDAEDDITIRQFLMRRTTATFESESVERPTEVEIDEIEMRDLHGTPDEVAGIIAARVIDEVAGAVSPGE
jgi:hypothetical protein